MNRRTFMAVLIAAVSIPRSSSVPDGIIDEVHICHDAPLFSAPDAFTSHLSDGEVETLLRRLAAIDREFDQNRGCA